MTVILLVVSESEQCRFFGIQRAPYDSDCNQPPSSAKAPTPPTLGTGHKAGTLCTCVAEMEEEYMDTIRTPLLL